MIPSEQLTPELAQERTMPPEGLPEPSPVLPPDRRDDTPALAPARFGRLRRLFGRRHRRKLLVGLLLLLGLGAVGGPHLWAYYHYTRAKAALERYEFAVARDHLRRCLRVWDSRPKVWLLAGQTSRRLDDFDDAENCLNRVQDLLENKTDEALTLEWALLRAQRGDPDPVLPYLRSLIEADHPAAPLILEAAARGYMRTYRFHDAAFLLRLWLDRRPDDPFALYHLGVVRENIGPREEAVDAYRRVLEKQPGHDEARLRLVYLLLDLAQPRDALDTLRPALDRRGDDPFVRVAHARCLHGVGESRQAERVLDELLAGTPHYAPAVGQRGKLAFEAQQYDRAETLLREAIRLQPGNSDAYYTLFQVLRQKGDEEQARVVLQEMERVEKDLRRLQAISSDELGRSPKDPRLYLEMGAILLRQGETPRGLSWLRDALRLDPNNTAVHQALADHYKQVGNEKLAAHHARMARP